MAALVPAIIWVVGAFVCFYIARFRNVKMTVLWMVVVAILGPLAIPLVFLAKPDRKKGNPA